MAQDDSTMTKSITFTEGESKLVMAIMRCSTGDVQVPRRKSRSNSPSTTDCHQFDADAVAAELGYKSGVVVKARWSQIKTKKLGKGAAPSSGVQKPTPSKKATPKKAPTGGAIKGEDDDEVATTPTKTPKKRAPKPEVKEEEEEEQLDIKQDEREQAVETTEDAE